MLQHADLPLFEQHRARLTRAEAYCRLPPAAFAVVSSIALAVLLEQRVDHGGLLALLLAALTVRRKSQLKGKLDTAELPRIREFIQAFTARYGLESVVDRLEAATEETLLTLLQSRAGNGGKDGAHDHERPDLLLQAREEDGEAVLEFKVGAASADELNLQDRLTSLDAETRAARVEQEVSLRLLRHLASSVRHQQFHDTDILTLRVSAGTRRGS